MNKTTLGQLRVVDGERLRVQVDNDQPGRKVLVFLNGMGATLDYWDPVIERLTDFTCVRYDRPGLGGSPTSTRSSADITTEVDRLLAAAGTVKSSHSQTIAVGHSYGGLLAETAVRLHPEQFAGLVLVDGTDPRDHADDNTLIESALAAAMSVAVHVPGVSHLVGNTAERVVTYTSTVAPDGPRLSTTQRALVETSRHVRGTLAEDLRIPRQCRQALDIARTHGFPNIPVALLVGSEARTLRGKRRATEWIAQNNRRVGQFGDRAAVQILRSGHLMMFDDPDAVASAIRGIATGEPG